MSLREDMYKYQQLTGEDANSKSIERIGAFLDGYELCQSQIQDAIAEINNLKGDNFPNSYYVKIIKKHTKVGD